MQTSTATTFTGCLNVQCKSSVLEKVKHSYLIRLADMNSGWGAGDALNSLPSTAKNIVYDSHQCALYSESLALL